MFYLYPPRDSSSAGSWVQAIGSIVAICVAIFLSVEDKRQAAAVRRRELAEQRRADNEAKDRALTQLYMLAERAFQCVNNFRESLRAAQGEPPFVDVENIWDIHQKLLCVPTYALSSVNSARAFVLSDLLASFRGNLEAINATAGGRDLWHPRNPRWFKLARRLSSIKRQIEIDIRERGLQLPAWTAAE
ncbi:hypothetical protein [Chitinasiproducens palmae]|nr:hypothetical protein [Chitinasiproducens palmae]